MKALRLAAGLALVWLNIGACTVVTDTSEYTEGECGSAAKNCPNAQGRLVCVSNSDPAFGCSAASCAPCKLANAQNNCGADGKCAIQICAQGYQNCDSSDVNGCEVDLSSDVRHCGACDRDCTTRALTWPNVATPTCFTGVCSISRCSEGWLNCNSSATDGCEVKVTTQNCGLCAGCPEGEHCDASDPLNLKCVR